MRKYNLSSEKNGIMYKNSINFLYEALIMKEISLSYLLKAEALIIQGYVGENLDFPYKPSNKEIIQFNQVLNQVMDNINMNESLNKKKIELITNIMQLQDKDLI